jgi:hypothetical protein
MQSVVGEAIWLLLVTDADDPFIPQACTPLHAR